ncbi:MAG: lysophospholipase L1-like esterase [Flavobacteriales bacterium]|jgi:lysophospholipase L1-like esterase
MNKLSINLLLAAGAVTITLGSCLKTEFDARERTSGDADFKSYVAVGNSLTQGYQDAGVHNEAEQQENSYPAIVARQMAKVELDMNDFDQPLVTRNGAGFKKLEVDAQGELGAVDYPEDASWASWGNQSQTYNNLGVAGIAVWQVFGRDNNERIINHAILSGVTLLGGAPLNPYGRFLDFGADPTIPFGGGDTYSYVDKIKQTNPTFFTNWLGNNDVLGWSLAGGDEGETNVPIFGTVKTSPLTPVDEFTTKYDSVLSAFAAKGAEGVCATMPFVTSIPMFTTVDEEYMGVPEIWITEGVTGTVRLKTENDLVLLYALTDLDNGIGYSQADPLDHTLVLDEAEVLMSQNRVVELNAAIVSLSAKYGFGVVDMQGYLEGFKTGFSVDGVDLSARFIEGGVFSLDGVHPNTKGYAVIADKFINAINETYNSNIPNVDINAYKGIIFPND